MITQQELETIGSVVMGVGQRIQIWSVREPDGSTTTLMWDSTTQKARSFPSTEINPLKLLYSIGVMFIALETICSEVNTPTTQAVKQWLEAVSGAQ